MAKKKKKKLKMKKKAFIILIVGICAVALISEIVLMMTIFSKKKGKPGSVKKSGGYNTNTGLVINSRGNAYRLMRYVEYGPVSAQLHEFGYDKYGRRTVEIVYQAVRTEPGKELSDAELKQSVASKNIYDYDKNNRMTKAVVFKNNVETVYTYEYDPEKGYLKSILFETSGSAEGPQIEKSFNERGMVISSRLDNASSKRFDTDSVGHITEEIRVGETGESIMFFHDLKYEGTAPEYGTLISRKIKNNTIVDTDYWGQASDRIEEYDSEGRVLRVKTDGIATPQLEYVYDEQGNILREISRVDYAYDGHYTASKSRTCKYIDSGLLTEEYEKNNSGYTWGNNGTKTTTIEYGEKDRVLRKTVRKDNEKDDTSWEYDYDDNGNLTQIREIKGDAERITAQFEYVCADIPKENLTQEDRRASGKEYDRRTRMDPMESVFNMPAYFTEKRWGETYCFSGQ